MHGPKGLFASAVQGSQRNHGVVTEGGARGPGRSAALQARVRPAHRGRDGALRNAGGFAAFRRWLGVGGRLTTTGYSP
jgi:hypothetical protein